MQHCELPAQRERRQHSLNVLATIVGTRWELPAGAGAVRGRSLRMKPTECVYLKCRFVL